MSDKRGNWSKQAKKDIWQNYTQNKSKLIWKESYLQKFNLAIEAPCPECGKTMLKAQYQGVQPDKEFSWDIDHLNGNPYDNNLSNLQPMHPWCNKNKG